ncbi:hypothetical protein BZA77DRAFT_123289 [Pyronema omphalodes]|nr:hypothetical protein BZA77DRAFT_123289 [Pyronema omphalodes]
MSQTEDNTSTLLDVLIGNHRYAVKSISDLNQALKDSRDKKDVPTMIICRSYSLPRTILATLYHHVPQLNQFGIKLPGFSSPTNSFSTSDSESDCYVQQLQCKCCSNAALKCGWKAQEVTSTHYAEEKPTTKNQGNCLSPQDEKTSISKITFRSSSASGNVRGKNVRDKKNNFIKSPEHNMRVFADRKRKFFFLSNNIEDRRFVFTIDRSSNDKSISDTTTLKNILSLDQICKEWDAILSCFKENLIDAVMLGKKGAPDR